MIVCFFSTGPVLIKSAESPTFLNVYREDDQKYDWKSADAKCKEFLGSDASLPNASTPGIYNVSVQFTGLGS